MQNWIAAAFALASASSLSAQSTPASTDLTYDKPIGGSWTYSGTAQGSEATFAGAYDHPQLTIRCTRATRHVSIIKPTTTAAPFLWVWTSSQMKNVPAVYDATAAHVTADFAAFDPLLDAIASSRGRIGFSTSGTAALVLPPWSEVSRVIEDCRV